MMRRCEGRQLTSVRVKAFRQLRRPRQDLDRILDVPSSIPWHSALDEKLNECLLELTGHRVAVVLQELDLGKREKGREAHERRGRLVFVRRRTALQSIGV